MKTVIVKLGAVNSDWQKPCQQAVKDLNMLFKSGGVGITLATSGTAGPVITVKNDPGINGSAVHGENTAETTDTGQLIRAEVRLPVKVTINTPQGIRDAGPGILEVIAAHEIVHALGHPKHNSHLMAQTMQMVMGNGPAGDKLGAAGINMPALQLAPSSISDLKTLWA